MGDVSSNDPYSRKSDASVTRIHMDVDDEMDICFYIVTLIIVRLRIPTDEITNPDTTASDPWIDDAALLLSYSLILLN